MRAIQLLFAAVLGASIILQTAAQVQPSTRDVACPSCKPGEAAPKLASDCPLPTRRLLRGGGGHSGGGHSGGGFRSGGGSHVDHTASHTPSSFTRSSFTQNNNQHAAVARNVVNQQQHHDNHHDDHHDNHQDHQHDHNHDGHVGPSYRPAGSVWWLGGPTYVNNNVYENQYTEVNVCQPYQCQGSDVWDAEECQCKPLAEPSWGGLFVQDTDNDSKRKLLSSAAATAATAVDRATIEPAAGSGEGSHKSEMLPAHPGRNQRLRSKPYRRASSCKEGQPCRKATRSYRITVHHE